MASPIVMTILTVAVHRVESMFSPTVALPFQSFFKWTKSLESSTKRSITDQSIITPFLISHLPVISATRNISFDFFDLNQQYILRSIKHGIQPGGHLYVYVCSLSALGLTIDFASVRFSLHSQMMSQFNMGHFSSFFNCAWNLVYTRVLIWLFKWFDLEELHIVKQLLFSSNLRDIISMCAIQRVFMILPFLLW